MNKRPELTPGTSHSTTRYEIEIKYPGTGKWSLGISPLYDLALAKRYVTSFINQGNEARIIVISETRRLLCDR